MLFLQMYKVDMLGVDKWVIDMRGVVICGMLISVSC